MIDQKGQTTNETVDSQQSNRSKISRRDFVKLLAGSSTAMALEIFSPLAIFAQDGTYDLERMLESYGKVQEGKAILDGQVGQYTQYLLGNKIDPTTLDVLDISTEEEVIQGMILDFISYNPDSEQIFLDVYLEDDYDGKDPEIFNPQKITIDPSNTDFQLEGSITRPMDSRYDVPLRISGFSIYAVTSGEVPEDMDSDKVARDNMLNYRGHNFDETKLIQIDSRLGFFRHEVYPQSPSSAASFHYTIGEQGLQMYRQDPREANWNLIIDGQVYDNQDIESLTLYDRNPAQEA